MSDRVSSTSCRAAESSVCDTPSRYAAASRHTARRSAYAPQAKTSHSWQAAQPIEALADDLLFTAIDTGNPHLVARVGRIDLERLDELGRRANGMRDILPHGVNLSLCEQRDGHTLFVATYERGAGITLSCGTAMTSAATAAVLADRMQAEHDIRVMNRGGMVLCRTHIGREGIVTRLTGNATFEWSGSLDFDGEALRYDVKPTSSRHGCASSTK